MFLRRSMLAGALLVTSLGCAFPTSHIGPVVLAQPEPPVIELSSALAAPSASEAPLPKVMILVVGYPNLDGLPIRFRAYAGAYFDMAGHSLPNLDVTRRDLPLPVTLPASTRDALSEIRLELHLIEKTVVQYLAGHATEPVINCRISLYGEDAAGQAIQVSLNVPVRRAPDASPSPSAAPTP